MITLRAALAITGALILGSALYLVVVARDAGDRPDASSRPQVPSPGPAAFASTAGVPPRSARDTSPASPGSGAAATAVTPATVDRSLAEASQAYDRGDLEGAGAIAGRVLAAFPSSVPALRLVIATSCVRGEEAIARAHYSRLPPGDRAASRLRCARYGVRIPDEP
jgi:hypothetical protein